MTFVMFLAFFQGLQPPGSALVYTLDFLNF